MSVILTEKAASEVKRIITEQQKEVSGTFLRIGVQGGGCSGFQYALNFDESADLAADEVVDHFGIQVAVDKKSALYLEGTTIDFYDGLDKRGFVFNNPNVTKSCGCGSSFSM